MLCEEPNKRSLLDILLPFYPRQSWPLNVIFKFEFYSYRKGLWLWIKDWMVAII